MKRVLILCLAALPLLAAAADSFRDSWDQWHAQRVQRLTSETGWLTLVGLYWFDEGETPFGSDPAGTIALPPAPGVPGRAGVFVRQGRDIRLKPAPGANLRIAGAPAAEQVLKVDDTGSPDILTVGPYSMFLIRRGDRVGLRVKNPDSPVRRDFNGIDTYPPDPAWKITGRFTPHAEPRTVRIPTVLGTIEPMQAPGTLTFRLPSAPGKDLTLEPVLEEPDAGELFIIFKDSTSGHETYGPGRFLYIPMPKDGKAEIDFNRAYNPPCAFTPFATCPLPPKQNVLPVRVEAGEKSWGHPGGEHP